MPQLCFWILLVIKGIKFCAGIPGCVVPQLFQHALIQAVE